jgi:hypothetical protein
MVESLLVALLGGACAFLIALWTIHGLRTLLPPDTPRLQSIRVQSGVAYFALGASLLAALLSGLAPALLSSRRDVGIAMKEGAAGAGARASGHNALRQLLVVAEIALAVTLVIGATLAIRSFARILNIDPGFRPDHLVTMRIDFPKFRFPKVSKQPISFSKSSITHVPFREWKPHRQDWFIRSATSWPKQPSQPSDPQRTASPVRKWCG